YSWQNVSRKDAKDRKDAKQQPCSLLAFFAVFSYIKRSDTSDKTESPLHFPARIVREKLYRQIYLDVFGALPCSCDWREHGPASDRIVLIRRRSDSRRASHRD